MKSKLISHGAALLSLVTVAALVAYPLPFCIGCKYPNPWGHQSVKGEVPVALWLLIAPFIAGAFPIKKGWLVPIVVVLALVATQPLGGVAWWSLREIEGPFIIVLGLPVTAMCFAFGWVTRYLLPGFRGR